MKLKFLCGFFILSMDFVTASDLVQEILSDLFEKAAPASTVVAVGNTSGFTYDFKNYSCAKTLSEAINYSIDSAIVSGRSPILVCDIDETLVKRISGSVTATNFYANLRDSGAISKSHGVLALTARSIGVEKIVDLTIAELCLCVPEFFTHMRSPSNFDGNLPNLDFSSEKRFLHDNGLLVMGMGGLSKRQVLDVYLSKLLANGNKSYDLIFVDNDMSWFPEFCIVSGYDPKIVKGHFFHYDWEQAERMGDFSLAGLYDAQTDGMTEGAAIWEPFSETEALSANKVTTSFTDFEFPDFSALSSNEH